MMKKFNLKRPKSNQIISHWRRTAPTQAAMLGFDKELHRKASDWTMEEVKWISERFKAAKISIAGKKVVELAAGYGRLSTKLFHDASRIDLVEAH